MMLQYYNIIVLSGGLIAIRVSGYQGSLSLPDTPIVCGTWGPMYQENRVIRDLWHNLSGKTCYQEKWMCASYQEIPVIRKCVDGGPA